jgi:glycosyltransferase involved in cell wall biosynthesis
VVCRDEADRLAACLDSLGWVDELVVLDLESEDGSRDLARRAGARVLAHPPVPIVETVRNVAADAAMGEWALVVDPDERVSPGLARELRRLAARDDVDAVVLPRMNLDFGHAPTSPLQRYEPQLRMYRRAAVRWPTFPNALPQVAPERVARVAARDDLTLVHDRNRTIPEAIDRVRRYAPAQAQAMIDAGEVFTAARMARTLAEKLYRHFVVSRALRDGVPGLMRAGLLVAFHFYVWAAFWQLSGADRTPPDDALLRRADRALGPLRVPYLWRYRK